MPVSMALEQPSCRMVDQTAFASKTLTDVETQYANIEWNYLSVSFGLEQFHTYYYCRHIIVHNDNKPFEMIQKKLFTLPHFTYKECFYTYKI